VSEMKLIMENWNKYLLKEADESAVANAIVDMFDLDKAEDQIEKESEGKQELEEIVVSGAIAATIFTKMVGTLALGGLLGKISNWFKEKLTGSRANFVDSFTEIVESAARTLATLGLNKIVNVYIRQNVFDSDKKQEYQKLTEQVSNIIVFIITLGAAGTEVYNGAKDAGGLARYISELARASGITDLNSIANLYELFETSVDTGEGTFNSVKFLKGALQSVSTYLRGVT
jgi:hypothetical protein